MSFSPPHISRARSPSLTRCQGRLEVDKRPLQPLALNHSGYMTAEIEPTAAEVQMRWLESQVAGKTTLEAVDATSLAALKGDNFERRLHSMKANLPPGLPPVRAAQPRASKEVQQEARVAPAPADRNPSELTDDEEESPRSRRDLPSMPPHSGEPGNLVTAFECTLLSPYSPDGLRARVSVHAFGIAIRGSDCAMLRVIPIEHAAAWGVKGEVFTLHISKNLVDFEKVKMRLDDPAQLSRALQRFTSARAEAILQNGISASKSFNGRTLQRARGQGKEAGPHNGMNGHPREDSARQRSLSWARQRRSKATEQARSSMSNLVRRSSFAFGRLARPILGRGSSAV